MMMVMMMIVLTTWSDDDCDGDDCADHTEVMRPADGQVALDGAAHYQENRTAESDPEQKNFPR